MLTNTRDMNTYAYKYRGYEHICLQIPGIWTHMLTNTGDMNTYAYKYRDYGHMLTNTRDTCMNTYAYKYRGYENICLQIPGIWTHAYKYQGYGHIWLQIPGIWSHMLTKDKHFLLLIKGPYKSK